MNDLNKDLVFEKLLKYGLFPEKISKIFNSESFGSYVLTNGLELYQNNHFSDIKFRLTRNNNAPRLLSIPHPAPYYKLCNQLKNNWDKISIALGDFEEYRNRSMIIPTPNNLNKRLVSMLTYERRKDVKFLILDKSFKAKYFIHADIANCYPSIYTHSVPWALVGKTVSKRTMLNKDLWYNKLDASIRYVQRNETVGIPIGPDTSTIISEIILSQIDKKLSKYNYFRYIDDYKCYCNNKDEAENFINDLSKELESYNLRLNQKKTEITKLPLPFDEDWINELKKFSSFFLNYDELKNKHINILSQFFDLIIKLVNEYPDDSPIRYAVKLLANKTFKENDVYAYVILNLSRICFIYPYFIDVFDDIFTKNTITQKLKSNVEIEINSLLKEHLNYLRSDVSLWGIYLAIKYDFEIENFEEYSNSLIEDRDCLPVLLCYYYSVNKKIDTKKYIHLISTLIEEQVEDEWWVYIYEIMILNKAKTNLKKVKYRDFYLKMIEQKISFVNGDIFRFKIAKNQTTDFPF
jgi:hypothetical protein